MKRMLAHLTIASAATGWLGAQNKLCSQTPDANPTSNANAAASAAPAPTIVRDPRTGLLYQQEVQMVDQPVVSWQRKVVDQTVVTPQVVYENQQVPQTVYVAKTEYVLQTKLKGWWNPFAQPTYAYEYVPVTRWVPQTQYQTVAVPSVKMVPRTEKVPVDQPVQTTQKVAQVTLRPLSAASTMLPNGTTLPNGTMLANNQSAQGWPSGAVATNPLAWTARTAPAAATPTATWASYQNSASVQPLVASLPVLSHPRPLTSWQPGPLLTAPVTGLRNVARAVAAPFNTQATYSSPTAIATLPSTSATRDLNQAGMQATVLR